MAKGNFIEAEGLVKKLNDAFEAHVEVVKRSVKEVRKLNNEYNALPSDYVKGMAELQKLYKEQEKAIKKLQDQIDKLGQSRTRGNRQTSEEIVNQRTLAQQADRQARATSTLVGAYANLNAQHQIASKRLQDLIARGRLATQTQREYDQELRVAQREFNRLNGRVLEADRSVQRFNRNVGNYPKLMSGIGSLMSAFGIAGGLTLFAQLSTDAFNLTKELQSLNKAMLLVTGSQSQFMQEQEFLSKIANDFGIELVTLTRLYTQFYVSAKDKLSSREIQDIFTSISKASASMGLSVQQQERAFLALNQMMSKGTIQAEELRGQLGEALPGAFGIMAKAVGVTEIELGKMMKAGELLASDVLPKFARQLEITYGIENVERIDSITSAQNRLSNSVTELINIFTNGEGAVSKFFVNMFDHATTNINILKSLGVVANEMLPKTEKQNNLLAKQNGIKEADVKINSKLEVQQEKLNLLQKQYSKLYKFKDVQGYDKLIEQKEKDIKLQIELIKQQEIERGKTIQYIKTTATDKIESLRKEIGSVLLVINGEKANAVAKEQSRKKLKELNKEIMFYYGQLEFANNQLDLNTKKKKENTDQDDKQTKKVKESNDLLIGSVAWLEKEIALLKEKQRNLSTTTDEYASYNDEIKTLTGSLEILLGKQRELSKVVSELKPAGFSFGTLGESANNAMQGLTPLGTENLEESGKEWQDYWNEWSGVALDAINTVQQAQQQSYENELRRLELSRNNAILFAGESASAREEIDRQYDAKRREILKRQAREQKALAITESIINTAAAVIASLRQTPPPAGIPLAVAVGVIGAAQTALIASQQIPQFYKGTDNAPEGWAWTDEKGAELHLDRFGKVKDFGSDKGARLKYLDKGDKILTASQTEQIMFNNELNGILSNNQIGNAPSVVNNIDLGSVNARLDNLTNTIKNKSSITIIEDRRGKRIFEEKQRARKEIVSRTIRCKGYDV